MTDKQLNKRPERQETWADEVCRAATLVAARCHMTGSPSGDGLPTSSAFVAHGGHELSLITCGHGVPATDNALFTVGGSVTAEGKPTPEVCSLNQKKTSNFYISKLISQLAGALSWTKIGQPGNFLTFL